VVALFAALYLPLVLVPRPIFVYSAVPVLPFALLAVGRALDRAWERRPRAAMAVAALLLATAALAYPIATSRPVPAALYAPVLRALGPAR
jgi:dolichyl-phosphate-mannose--protein O-mannosyl transferase